MRETCERVLVLAVCDHIGLPQRRCSWEGGRSSGKRSPTLQAAAAACPAAPAPTRADEALPRSGNSGSALLKTLDVRIKRSGSVRGVGQRELTRVWRPPESNLAGSISQKVSVDDKGEAVLKPYERIVLHGDEVWQYKALRAYLCLPALKRRPETSVEDSPFRSSST